MSVNETQMTAEIQGEGSIETALKKPAWELLLYRLRCGRTANGLSHYYMYGDLEPEGTVL